MCMCMYLCLFIYVYQIHPGAHRGQRTVLGLLELDVQVVIRDLELNADP